MKNETKEKTMIVHNSGPQDVIMGRGHGPNDLPGNKAYRKLIEKYYKDYLKGTMHGAKAKVARQVVEEVHKSHGRFLRKFGSQRAYEVITDEQTLTIKIKLAFQHHERRHPPAESDMPAGSRMSIPTSRIMELLESKRREPLIEEDDIDGGNDGGTGGNDGGTGGNDGTDSHNNSHNSHNSHNSDSQVNTTAIKPLLGVPPATIITTMPQTTATMTAAPYLPPASHGSIFAHLLHSSKQGISMLQQQHHHLQRQQAFDHHHQLLHSSALSRAPPISLLHHLHHPNNNYTLMNSCHHPPPAHTSILCSTGMPSFPYPPSINLPQTSILPLLLQQQRLHNSTTSYHHPSPHMTMPPAVNTYANPMYYPPHIVSSSSLPASQRDPSENSAN